MSGARRHRHLEAMGQRGLAAAHGPERHRRHRHPVGTGIDHDPRHQHCDRATSSTGGNVNVASAIVAAVTAGASQPSAGAAATAITQPMRHPAADDSGGGRSCGHGLAGASRQRQATSPIWHQSATAGGASAQGSRCSRDCLWLYQTDILTNKQNSTFIARKLAALTLYFTKFLLNADQWDGYNAERKQLMQHLTTISRTWSHSPGDIHSFFAGTVGDDFDAAEGGTPTMVDLVTAGMSSIRSSLPA